MALPGRVEKSKAAVVESIVLLSPSAGELVDGIGNTVKRL
jgi:hypothetical protein